MPIIIPQDLPAGRALEEENVFVMNEYRALTQDIRPLKIAILNLMPTKEATELQLLRLLANIPIQVEVDLLTTRSYQPKNTPFEHLEAFYKGFEDMQGKKYDGMVITGAPVEHLEFEEVVYWPELTEIMEFARKNVFSTLHICWAAQAALYHHFGMPKYELNEKMFGVFPHQVLNKRNKLVRGFDDVFYVPHSRHTEVRMEDLEQVGDLEVLAVSDEAGVYLIASKDGRLVFQTGHAEYDPFTLKAEYERDLKLGRKISIPKNYFPDDDPSKEPVVRWRGHANLLFANWLNYFVYQETPYDLAKL
ncbi:homoserine O-succinyltransferase [Clostridiales bacterium PH28_bin88]|nr:homoserine O-succinyltransferase [Clostridiales bacterium PH28_bin88]